MKVLFCLLFSLAAFPQEGVIVDSAVVYVVPGADQIRTLKAAAEEPQSTPAEAEAYEKAKAAGLLAAKQKYSRDDLVLNEDDPGWAVPADQGPLACTPIKCVDVRVRAAKVIE